MFNIIYTRTLWNLCQIFVKDLSKIWQRFHKVFQQIQFWHILTEWSILGKTRLCNLEIKSYPLISNFIFNISWHKWRKLQFYRNTKLTIMLIWPTLCLCEKLVSLILKRKIIICFPFHYFLVSTFVMLITNIRINSSYCFVML